MDIYGKIADKLKNIAGQGLVQQSMLFVAVVKKIEGSTCVVELDELAISDVRLRAVVNNEKEQLLVVPKLGSYVRILAASNDMRDLSVIAYSEIDSVNITIDNTIVDVTKDGVVFNGGKLDGMVKVEAMVDWMTKVYQDLQTLKSQLSLHPTTGNGAPLGLTFNPTASSPEVSNFANKKVKQ